MHSLDDLLDTDTIRCLSCNENGGAFEMKSPVDGSQLRIIASWDSGWDHVSVSMVRRCPNWREMEYVAKTFFLDTEYAFQLHVPPSEHINCHPYVLHWWRCHKADPPLPPMWMV